MFSKSANPLDLPQKSTIRAIFEAKSVDPKTYSPPSVRQLLQLYSVVLIKHVAFFTIWAKLTMAFTCTSLLLNLYTSVFGSGCGFGFEQKFWRIDGFGEKKARIGGFAYPYSPPSLFLPRKGSCDVIESEAAWSSG